MGASGDAWVHWKLYSYRRLPQQMGDTSKKMSLTQDARIQSQSINFPAKKLSNKDWRTWFNFWHSFTLTRDKLKVPLGNWIHPTHCIWKWYYRVHDNNLQRLDDGTQYHYRLQMGHQGTRITKMYHLEREEPYRPSVILGLPTSVLGLFDQQVVKLSEGPALANVPKETTNFWEFLYTWGGHLDVGRNR